MIRLVTRMAPKTFDPETRTLEAIAATGAMVNRGGYFEQLDMAGADLSQIVGAPVLDSHRTGSLADQLGVATGARMEGQKLIVAIKLSTRAAPYLEEVAEGTLGAVSAGYAVELWGEARGPAKELIRVAKRRWTPREISLVSLPADPGAKVRTSCMDGDDEATIETATPPGELPAGHYWRPTIGEDGSVTYAAAAIPPAETRSAPLVEMQRRQAQTPLRATVRVGASSEDPAIVNTRMGEALYARTNPQHQLSEPARAYFGLTIADIGREILARSGVPVTGMGPSGIITRALHTTSDFSVILGDTVNRTLREAYGTVPSGVQTLVRQTTARDFRKKTRIMLSDFPALEPVGEHGEFASGTMQEAKETFAISTFGRIIGISRQEMVNDDLGAFTDMSARIGRAA